jgi:hypothetical protein
MSSCTDGNGFTFEKQNLLFNIIRVHIDSPKFQAVGTLITHIGYTDAPVFFRSVKQKSTLKLLWYRP